MGEMGGFTSDRAFAEETCRLVSPHSTSTLDHLSLPGRKAPLSLYDFLEHLLARAPRELIRSSSSGDLARIVSESLAILEEMESAPNRIAIKAAPGLQGPALFIALPDCPFIISSIAERLSEAKVKVATFQHPIVIFKGAAAALSYIEIIEPTEVADLAPVTTSLRETLTALERIVADFEPMRAVITSTAHSFRAPTTRSAFGELAPTEINDFLKWLADGSFFFLGTALWSDSHTVEFSQGLGAYQIAGTFRDLLTNEVREDIQRLAETGNDISIRKLRINSSVHRPATVLNILLKIGQGQHALLAISGYLTSKAWSYEAEDIPILRLKVAQVVNQEGIIPNTHDYKYRIEVIDNMPTDEALAMPVQDISDITQLALGLFSSESMRTKIVVDTLRRRALTVVILPTERYSAAVRSTIQKTLEQTFRAPPQSSDVHLDSSKKRQLRLYVSTPLPRDFSGPVPEELLSRTLSQAALTWEEHLIESLSDEHHQEAARGTFPQDYQAATSIQAAAVDLEVITSLSPNQPTAASLYTKPESPRPPVLSIFSLSAPLSISQATPVLENIGLEVLSAHSYTCSFEGRTVFLLKLTVRPYDGEAIDAEAFNTTIAQGLTEILAGRSLNDPLNLLLRKTTLTVREILMLRSYCALLWQIQKISTKRTMWEALAGAPAAASELFSLFRTMFDPSLSLPIDQRRLTISTHQARFAELLRQIPDITHDRILRALLTLVSNTVRTNYYSGTDTLACKITPQTIECMPHPRPLFEIFVFSSRIEGTHLRSATVARGGIRWSDRIDDYRAEVLGLMKTQKVKNVIIVPSGAKGGFIVKHIPTDPEQIPAAVERSYREYITALLSLADNQVNGAVVHPPQCVVHDSPDPYFVVAADKGTATFSDIANSVAQTQLSFWLGDAFASGGSNGYDHKKYGITAKGGWECVLRHFRDIGIDYETKAFSVIGIGDMSGDVFGNALLLNPRASLIAAFNHKHIFVDPTPNNEQAFAERHRLFTTPRTQWSDFSRAIISRGGGVFSRFDKEILLSPEMRIALGIGDEIPATVDGETLITLLMKAPVDLLWNGGIGTYVKSSSESHADVNDGTNDRVRVNANELRARVVGEGGNLGFTQRARIEYAALGGRINTDAIDNSGGVDLSDHEVNLKLLLNPIVRSGALTIEDRNALLRDIASDVVESVLHHNRSQSLMLSIAQKRSVDSLENYRALIREMHRLGYLDRARDFLPGDEEIDERITLQAGLTRPELAFCSAAVKMWIKEDLCSSILCRDQSLNDILMGYFPAVVRERFPEAVSSHPLRAEIIASELANEVVSAVDIPFIFSATTATGQSASAVIAAVLAADRILGLPHLRSELQRYDTPQNASLFQELWTACGETLRKASLWLLNVHGTALSITTLASLYGPGFEALAQENVPQTGSTIEGLSSRDSARLRLLSDVIPTLEILWTAHEYKGSPAEIARVFNAVVSTINIVALLSAEHSLRPSNRWEQELIRGSFQEIRRTISTISGQLFTKGITSADAIARHLNSANGFTPLKTTITEITQRMTSAAPFEIAALPVIARQLRAVVV